MNHNHPYRQRFQHSHANSTSSSSQLSPTPSQYQSPMVNTPDMRSPNSRNHSAPVTPNANKYNSEFRSSSHLDPNGSTASNPSPGTNQISPNSAANVSTSSNAPYPVDNFIESSDSDDPMLKLNNDVGQLHMRNDSSDVDNSYPSLNDSTQYPQHNGYDYDLENNGIVHPSMMTGSNSKPVKSNNSQFPAGITDTPPPVFNNSPIASYKSNSLSATSSVTNLNLGPSQNQHQFKHPDQSTLPNQTYSNPLIDHHLSSPSENNLVTSKFNNHNRSVSSTSSVFYDRPDNASMVDFNQNLITQYLGDNSNHLMPRIKTIELYRKNAKKSNDPTVLFQYAQYMLQTALLLDQLSPNKDNSPLNLSSVENSPRKGPVDSSNNSSHLNLSTSNFKKSHRAKNSSASLDISALSDENPSLVDDQKLKRSLLKEAIIYLKKLSDKGYTEAQYLLGDAFSSGALGKIENKESFLLFQSAAKHAHVESAYRTSYCYEEGLGTGRDSRKAIEYLKMAASKNHPAAMYKLGVYSFYGRMGLPNDVTTKKMGIKWLTRASNVANELIAAAPFELGKIYFNGFIDIVIADNKYALELYSQAAALGHVESAAILGHYYEIGEIVPQDSNLSIHYYTQAALGGDPNSMLSMCAWYLVGNEPYLPQDESESFEWAKRAALCELPKAQFALANFYDKGIGCTKNVNEAQKWYLKAAEHGDEKSISRLSNKETAARLNKKFKTKKKSRSNLNMSSPGKSTIDDKKAQDKDCIIV